jgi:hypothetical protein
LTVTGETTFTGGTTFTSDISGQDASFNCIDISCATVTGDFKIGPYVFPLSGGNSGEVLIFPTAPDVVLAWGAASGGDSRWDISGNDISNNNTGAVGIGGSVPNGFTDTSGNKLYVNGSAAVVLNITAYYSDERLKTFQGKIENPIEKINQLNGYYFVENELAKTLGYNNDRVQVGVSAQEVEKVLPEIVTKAPIDDKYKTVWYEKLTPLLIEGIKEQQKQIETMQKEIETMQKQIDDLN